MKDVTYAVCAEWLTGNTFCSESGATYSSAEKEFQQLKKNPAIKSVEIVKCTNTYKTVKNWRKKGG